MSTADDEPTLCKCGHDHVWKSGTILSSQGSTCGRCPCLAFEPMTADRDDLAAILLKHQPFTDGAFTCEWCHKEGLASTDAEDAAHVAQMVLESDWLRGVKAEAWDECWKTVDMWTDQVAGYNYGAHDNNPGPAPENPYRTTEDTDNTTDRTYKIPD